MNKTLFPIVAAASLFAMAQPSASESRPVVVFAAASLKNALDEASTAFAQKTGQRIVTSYAATPALVRQIEQGAPADVLVSADAQWMDYAASRRLIEAGSRVDLIGNSLVLVAPLDSPVRPVAIDRALDLAALAKGGRIAVADTRAVPAGKYAKAALEQIGLWSKAAPKLVMAENVRAALALAARGEAALAIVYASDARVEPRVRIVGEFPPSSHPAIVYPAALITTASPMATRYLAFLRSPEAASIFERFGFSVLRRAGSG